MTLAKDNDTKGAAAVKTAVLHNNNGIPNLLQYCSLGEELVLTISTESCIFKRKPLKSLQMLNQDNPADKCFKF